MVKTLGQGSVTKRPSAFDSFVTEIMTKWRQGDRRELSAWEKPQKELNRLARLDYVKYMRRTLGFRELHSLVAGAKKIWPSINSEQLRVASPYEREEIASDLKIKLQAAPYRGEEGMALRGFYVSKSSQMLKRPLIYLNTAHHPGAVAATFAHEVGHHVMSALMDSRDDGVHFFFDAEYYRHLSDPLELAADSIVSMAAYPEPIARKIFKTEWQWGLVARAGILPDEAFALIHSHIKKLVGIDFRSALPAIQTFHYLSGMIHYAKLRWALLAEYEL
jgi:hypothetical protein